MKDLDLILPIQEKVDHSDRNISAGPWFVGVDWSFRFSFLVHL